MQTNKTFVQPKGVSRWEKPFAAAAAYRHAYPVDLAQGAPFSCMTFKARQHRFLPGILRESYAPALLRVQAAANRPESGNPAFLSLARLLLFPEHEFW